MVIKTNIGFTHYQADPGPFGKNGLGGFLAVIATAFFAFTGTELVGLTAREASNPRVTVPKAIKVR